MSSGEGNTPPSIQRILPPSSNPSPRAGIGGRPTDLNPRTSQIVQLAVSRGLPLVRAAWLAGVDETTVRRWYNRGKSSPEDPPYTQFYLDIEAAKATHISDMLGIVSDCARGGRIAVDSKVVTRRVKTGRKDTQGRDIFADAITERVITRKQALPNWQPASWILERRYREEFGNTRGVPTAMDDPVELARDVAEEIDRIMGSVPTAEEGL